MRYWSNDVTPLMALAGHTHRCVTYLMGNHTIAERMFRVDPRVMNYAPLHTAITSRADGETRFTLDLPSSQFASFHDPAITEVGHLLDQKFKFQREKDANRHKGDWGIDMPELIWHQRQGVVVKTTQVSLLHHFLGKMTVTLQVGGMDDDPHSSPSTQ